MPFAPYVLAEDAERVFEITPCNRYAARFMTICCEVRPQWCGRIAGVVHVDNTARPQILRDEDNPLFAAILRRFREQTGIPVLINTSFNVHEEPIVNRPQECAKALVDGSTSIAASARLVASICLSEIIGGDVRVWLWFVVLATALGSLSLTEAVMPHLPEGAISEQASGCVI